MQVLMSKIEENPYDREYLNHTDIDKMHHIAAPMKVIPVLEIIVEQKISCTGRYKSPYHPNDEYFECPSSDEFSPN